jgi:hypothetical protein
MKSLLIAILAAVLAVPAFAAGNSRTITIAKDLTVGSTKLPAGDYKLSWTGTAPNVQVKFEQKNAFKPATVTVPATLVEEKNPHGGLVTSTQANVLTIQKVQFKDLTLTLSASPAASQ